MMAIIPKVMALSGGSESKKTLLHFLLRYHGGLYTGLRATLLKWPRGLSESFVKMLCNSGSELTRKNTEPRTETSFLMSRPKLLG